MMQTWRLRRTLFLGSMAVLLYAFLLGPILAVMIASFSEGQSSYFKFPPDSYSLEVYRRIPPKYFHALGLSFVVAMLSATISTTIGAMAAMGIVRGRYRAKEPLIATFRLPLQIPFVVTGVVFLQCYYRLSDLFDIELVGSLPGLVAAHVFVTIPYSVSAVAVVLLRAGPRLDEAASSLGATPWSAFRRVTLPTIMPGLFAGFFYAFIMSFGDIPVALFIVSSQYITLPVEIFQSLQFDFEPAVLAVSSIVVVLSVLMILAIQRLVGFDLVLPGSSR